MKIRRFKAENFRNIEKCDISFSSGVNLLHGKNAQGKTNAVEGIYIFSRGKSHRARDERELIKEGSDGFRIEIEYEDKDGINTLEYVLFGKERLRKKNGYKISRVGEMIGCFRSVLFYPDNLRLVKDGPEERRLFLNVAISQTENSYIKHYSDFKVALENRNTLLKFINKGMYVDEKELDAWSEEVAEHASFIFTEREKYIRKIEEKAKKIISDMSHGKEEISFIFKSDIENLKEREAVKREYVRKLTENREKEIGAGITLYGPHRDDIEIMLNGKSARSFSSQGQQRSIVLALKLAEGEVIKEIYGEYPVFLFDDVLSELDEERRKYVLEGSFNKNSEQIQIIITSCEEDKILNHSENIVEVSGGKYVSAYR